MGRPLFAGFLLALILVTPASAMAQPDVLPLPPREFSGVDAFLDAIAIEDEAALIIDTFWQPAIAALVAANPDKAEQARSFASEQRRAELKLYRPLVAMTLDRRAVELLNPDVGLRLDEVRQRRSAAFAGTGAVSRDTELDLAREEMAIRAAPAARVNGQFKAMARLAGTSDGAALRELIRNGYVWCIGKLARTGRHLADCDRLDRSPALQRLRNEPLGESLILVSGASYAEMAGMIQLGHAAGISLHSLLPPENVRAAGLNVPADLSLEELGRRHQSANGGTND